ncbi:response regulator transcription factor [Clostridium bornimense]|uniref:response regulator transcription factor n=1 Tax=Clostridium bornimense TaxID=1216932 RepID=UPI001C127B29|nr:response regulator transcription factor [Clostridium bornimense]MBU5315600.1 response regulator transcription factor [Clostridium bornimense]
MVNNRILIVDDDKNICELIKLYVESEGFVTKVVNEGDKVYDAFKEWQPDLIVLDVMLPGKNGFEILKDIKSESNVPVIMLTAKGSTYDKITGLDSGADDYIVKPFDARELIARIKAVLRRSNGNENNENDVLVFNDLKIDISSYTVYLGEKEIKMPPKELELLHFLAMNKNKVFTREELLCKVWGYDYPGDSRTVDVHIKRIREKVSDGEGWSLQTVWGVGYKFEVK